MLDLYNGFLELFPHAADVPMSQMWAALVAAALMGGIISLVYHWTHSVASPPQSLVVTLIMLCMLMAAVTMVIGNNTARAFGLVGALSIVRFRTVVDDTRDTAFVVFAVVVGMALGAGYLGVAFVSLIVVSAVVIALNRLQRGTAASPGDWTLMLRVSTGISGEYPWERLFSLNCEQANLQSTATARQGASLDMTYRLKLRAGVTPMQFLNDMHRLEGIQNIELRRN